MWLPHANDTSTSLTVTKATPTLSGDEFAGDLQWFSAIGRRQRLGGWHSQQCEI